MSTRMRGIVLSALGICLGSTLVAQAPQEMTGPPPILVIAREVVKTGQAPAHEKWEAGWPRAYAKANWPVHYLAASSLTGESRALFITGYASEEAWEKDNLATRKNTALNAELEALAAKDADFLKESSLSVFAYMKDISYHADVPLPTMRYFRIVAIQVKPGHGDHFVEVGKMVREAREKAKVDVHYAIYHRIHGGSTGLYLVFLPLKSLAENDQFESRHGAAFAAALGEEGQKKFTEFGMQAEESVESQIFEFSPKMSYPDKAFIAADPDFWAPKPARAAKPAAAKQPAKP